MPSSAASATVEGDPHVQLVGAPHDLQGEGLAGGHGVEGVVEVVDVGDVLAAGADDQVTLAQAGPGAGAAVLDQADEQAVPLGQADRAPQLAGHVGRGEADAEATGRGHLAGGQRPEAVPQGLVGGRAR